MRAQIGVRWLLVGVTGVVTYVLSPDVVEVAFGVAGVWHAKYFSLSVNAVHVLPPLTFKK